MNFTRETRKTHKNTLIKEVKRISEFLNKKNITQGDFYTYFNTEKAKPGEYRSLFGSFSSLKKASGFCKEPRGNYFIQKKLELRSIYKEIALKNGNRLSLNIIARDLRKSCTSTNSYIVTYFGGMTKLCKSIGCVFDSKFTGIVHHGNNPNRPKIAKENFKNSILAIASKHNNSISKKILVSDSVLSPISVENYAHFYYGGCVRMCKELGIIWIPSDRGIDLKELNMLQDIRKVYTSNDYKITRKIYQDKGKYKLEAIEDYFGSFGKACKEINIETESLVKATK